tara:strand:+ start:2424 stop:4064 length:1641 start_codon:yes stop_codon:yes gene_type:complete
MKKIIYIIGFSGTGKSASSQLASEALNWEYYDMDKIIENEEKRTISEMFETDGENWFREREAKLLSNLSKKTMCIISTGGGVPVSESNMKLMMQTGYVICLDASIEVIMKRLTQENIEGIQESSIRPKISDLSKEKITDFKLKRSEFYSKAHFTINTNYMSVEEVSNNIVYAVEKYTDSLNINHLNQFDTFCTTVKSKNNLYGVFVGVDIYNILPEVMKNILLKDKIFLLADEGSKKYMRQIQKIFESSNIATTTLLIEEGEKSKSLSTASKIYEWLSSQHADRGDVLIGIGGGVVGDITGFVASSYMRGIKFILIPTTLLAMSDSSIGGKTAVDINNIKNLTGSFYNPSLVFSDLQSLKTLPKRQITSGWAELIKHGFIRDKELLQDMLKIEDYFDLDTNLNSIIKRSIKIKGQIVSQDENEKYGHRIMLNYGHTLGHAIESSTNLERYTHGEAVSIGMAFAAKLSNYLDMLSDEDYLFHNKILVKFDLPISPTNIDWDKCFHLIKNDKKVKNGKINWILLESLGKSVVKNDIDDEILIKIAGDF